MWHRGVWIPQFLLGAPVIIRVSKKAVNRGAPSSVLPAETLMSSVSSQKAVLRENALLLSVNLAPGQFLENKTSENKQINNSYKQKEAAAFWYSNTAQHCGIQGMSWSFCAFSDDWYGPTTQQNTKSVCVILWWFRKLCFPIVVFS